MIAQPLRSFIRPPLLHLRRDTIASPRGRRWHGDVSGRRRGLSIECPRVGSPRVSRFRRSRSRRTHCNVMAASHSDRAEGATGGHPRQASERQMERMRRSPAASRTPSVRTLAVDSRRRIRSPSASGAGMTALALISRVITNSGTAKGTTPDQFRSLRGSAFGKWRSQHPPTQKGGPFPDRPSHVKPSRRQLSLRPCP